VKLHTKLLIGLAAGAALGALLHPLAGTPWLEAVNVNLLRPIGQIFLRLIFMIVVPMVFSALVLGVYELGQAHGLGAVMLRTLGYTIVLSTLSVLVGVGLVEAIRPGAAFQLSGPAVGTALSTVEANAATAKPFAQTIVELIPRNPVESAVRALDGDMLPLMIFALIFGIAVSAAGTMRVARRGAGGRDATGHDATSRHATARDETAGATNVLIRLLEQVFDACMRIVDYAMVIAPVAVFAIIFNTAFTFGTGVFASLFLYVGTVVAGLLLQQFLVYPVMLKTFGRRSPAQFFRDCRSVYLYAFSTASSNATLPLSLEVAERRLGVPPAVARFVLTVGATANQNGSALFEGVTVLFLAQVYAIDLTVGAEVRVLLMSILAGIGTAGVPGGSLPMVLLLAQSVGVPAEGMGLILGVDRLLDMCRTAVNVSGDLVIAALVSRAQGIADNSS
jgi:DAACS family dicarboxylate/amino acid:cation (Na+ or H+) symporter